MADSFCALAKELTPSDLSDEGKVTEVRLRLLANARSLMAVVPAGTLNDVPVLAGGQAINVLPDALKSTPSTVLNRMLLVEMLISASEGISKHPASSSILAKFFDNTSVFIVVLPAKAIGATYSTDDIESLPLVTLNA